MVAYHRAEDCCKDSWKHRYRKSLCNRLGGASSKSVLTCQQSTAVGRASTLNATAISAKAAEAPLALAAA